MKYSKFFGLAAAVAALVCADVNAEMIVNPDDNTLWIENGRDIKNGSADAGDDWRAGVKLLPDPAGEGFIIDSNSDADKQCSSGRYVKVAPEYSWLVWEITAIAPIPGKYLGLAMPMMVGPISEFAGNIPTGIFVRNINDRGGVTKENLCFLSIYAYNSKINVKYIKMVKKPDYCVEMKSDTAAKKQKIELGDNVTFKVCLKEPAEDVSLRFHHVYTMPQLNVNGEQAVQLKAEDGSDGKIWSATVPLKSISGDYKLLRAYLLIIDFC
ncbi:MAG: hypothetical protein WCV67_14465 [Victivallaceae bacterium]|jgi:hypothetical protein